MQQQITRGDYLEDLITIYVENNLQTELTDLYSQFIFQCGTIQKFLTPAQVIKISFSEQESQQLTNYNICYLAGITVDGHKETFNGSLAFNTRGEVVFYEPTPNGSVQSAATSDNSSACPCQGISGVFANCSQPAIKAYFSLNYVPTKLSELQNDTDFQDSVDVAESISIHNSSTEAHPYIQDLIATEASLRNSQTEALSVSIGAETTAREEAVSLAISTTEGYTDASVSVHNSSTEAHPYIQSVLTSTTEAIRVDIGDLTSLTTSTTSSIVGAINSEVSDRQNADSNLQTQIDGLAAASDVTDIVGTYAELEAYDTQHLNNNDIIKVLTDETHDNQPSYYRYNKTADTFSYIGSESAAYTKAQSDSIFVTKTTTVNNKPLSSDITLTYSDVEALSETYATVISANTSAIAANTTAIASNTSVISQHTTAIATNTNAISTINGKIPTDASTSNKLVSASTLSASIADFSNQDLSNLTSTGGARLHALKSYADKGELLTDAEGLADVKIYAHSTFDKSKFTVVGSPVITNDGIASEFSSSNYITKNLDFTNSNTIIIKGEYTWSGTYPSFTQIFLVIGTSDNSTSIRMYMPTSEGLEIYRTIDGVDYYGLGRMPIQANIPAYFTITLVQGTDINIKIIQNGVTIHDITETTNIPTLPNSSSLKLGYYCTDLRGSIDLKQFSITVDGVPVFSGNKTGINTIKPDDYTVVGTPTITSDGIASGLSFSDYFYLPNNVTLGNNFKLYLPFTAPSTIAETQIYRMQAGASFRFLMNIGSGTNVYFNFADDASVNTGNLNILPINTIVAGDDYIAVIELKNGTLTYGYIHNGAYTQSGTTTTTLNFTSAITFFTIGRGGSAGYSGSIDLNSFKIYVDGDLVYQPCLKIPYIESKTGSKIVNSIYRDRVNDMAEQFGYANYYTLDEDNGNFTLPQVELYGLIGQRTLRDSYRNGINYWELYSNRDLEQGGSCTSGVEVTFARPFADTNYVLSVPYSAKSTTAFTPTQTGDWIAKGKGVL